MKLSGFFGMCFIKKYFIILFKITFFIVILRKLFKKIRKMCYKYLYDNLNFYICFGKFFL